MDYGCTEDDFITASEIPVLDPPPGFEDIRKMLANVEDRFYDDPFSEEEEVELKPVLNGYAVSKFASEMAHSLLAVVKPKVKLRTKKPAPSELNCMQSECDVYSVPVDSLLNSEKQKQRQNNRQREIEREMNKQITKE